MQDSKRARVLAAVQEAAIARRIAMSACLGTLAACAMVPSAGAAVKGDRVIEVAHGRDLVILDGYPGNRELTVEVVRNGVTIATTGEKRYKTDRAGFLEINHVGGTDCFDGDTAPDIRPGDTIRATVGDPAEVLAPGEVADVDTMVVQNVTYDGAPVERMVERTIPAEVDPVTGDVITPESIVMEGTGIYEVQGTALHADGVTPLEGEIEVRLNHPSRADWDATGRRDWRVTTDASADGRYVAQFDTRGSADDAAVIEEAEMAALWLGGPAGEFSGYDGPGSPCNPAPNAGITKVSPRVVNAMTDTVTLEGYAPVGAAVTIDGAEVPVSENGGWTHALAAADLPDGEHTLTVVIDGQPVSRTIIVDRTAPAKPTANLAGGEVAMPQTIHLGGEGELRYTTDGSEPTRASLKYTGGISVTSALTIKAVAVDAAGNLSPVAELSYTEKPVVKEVPPAPKPEPQPVVEKPVVTEVVREVVVTIPTPAPPAPAPIVTPPPAVTPTVAGIDRVIGPKRVTLKAARRGVRIMVATKATALTAKASGGKLTVARKTANGYALTFKAKRRGTYKVTVAAPGAAAKAMTIKVH